MLIKVRFVYFYTKKISYYLACIGTGSKYVFKSLEFILFFFFLEVNYF